MQPITGQHFEFSAFWDAIRNAELRPQWHRITRAFANYPPFICHGTKVLERWFGGCVRYGMVRGHHASSSSRGSLWISGAFRGTPVQYTGGPIFLLGCLSLPPAVGGSHGMSRWSAASAWLVAAILFQTCFRPLQTGIHAWCWSIRRGCWRYDGGWYLVWDMTVYMALFFSFFLFSFLLLLHAIAPLHCRGVKSKMHVAFPRGRCYCRGVFTLPVMRLEVRMGRRSAGWACWFQKRFQTTSLPARPCQSLGFPGSYLLILSQKLVYNLP